LTSADSGRHGAPPALIAEIEAEFRATARKTGRDRLSDQVRAALMAVPREAFVPRAEAEHAGENRPLPIGYGQTISQPFIVALMTDLLDLRRDQRVLEIGTGSGYQAAILARLAGHVYSIETVAALSDRAAAALAAEGVGNVSLLVGDGAAGWAEAGPFDAIIVTAAAPEIPPKLIGQLAPGGRMIVPVGRQFETQRLMLVHKDQAGKITSRHVLDVAFVPLVGGGRERG